MADSQQARSESFWGLFCLMLVCGLAAGLVFVALLSLTFAEGGLPTVSWVTGSGFGLLLGLFFFLVARAAFKRQLRRQLSLLEGLAGRRLREGKAESVEDFSREVQQATLAIQHLVVGLQENLDQSGAHYQALIDASRFLLARANDGMQAAESARADVDGMNAKQQEVMGLVSALTDRAQDEAALSRELSASLEEIAGALELSGSKFQETSRSVDELVASIQDSTLQADQVARGMEGAARDLDRIGEAFDALRKGVEGSSTQADAVKQDAEQGLKVVESFMSEMDRIDASGQQATTAIQRLVRQTEEATKIIEVIKALVSDTELLAFNAAIIAAKAGAEGRGFSVVAEEMRELADRTTSSAGEIEDIVAHIRSDTVQVSKTIDSTSHFISRGAALSESTGDALRKIVTSSQQAASDSGQLVRHSEEERTLARNLLNEAGSSLRSMRSIAQNMQQQEAAIGRVQAGVSEMKAAADQISRGVDEQVRANREFDRNMLAREQEVKRIFEATRFQMDTVERIFEHFGRSSERLASNAEKSKAILEEVTVLEELAGRLRELNKPFQS